jgi:hypothetical protein
VVLPWAIEENRLALRALFRLFQQQVGNHDRVAAIATAQKLLRLNPADNHAVGPALANLTRC